VYAFRMRRDFVAKSRISKPYVRPWADDDEDDDVDARCHGDDVITCSDDVTPLARRPFAAVNAPPSTCTTSDTGIYAFLIYTYLFRQIVKCGPAGMRACSSGLLGLGFKVRDKVRISVRDSVGVGVGILGLAHFTFVTLADCRILHPRIPYFVHNGR